MMLWTSCIFVVACFPASQTPFVAFDVHYSHDPYNGVHDPYNHDVMKFDVVAANVGNGYNPQNGMFQVGSKAHCCQTPDCEILLAKIIITCSVFASRLLLAKIIITCSVLASRPHMSLVQCAQICSFGVFWVQCSYGVFSHSVHRSVASVSLAQCAQICSFGVFRSPCTDL